MTFISSLLGTTFCLKLVEVLEEFKDCFTWEYCEMPGLDRTLVEHRLPIREGAKPIKQTPRRMTEEVMNLVQLKIKKLLKARFIRTSRYVKWISNSVPVKKKNGKIRVCIDFWGLNGSTPKDEYSMPMVDMLIDSTFSFQKFLL